MRIKICGITRLDQARSILDLGISTIGFICVESSPRFIDPSMIGHIIENLAQEKSYVGVFANSCLKTIVETVKLGQLNAVQLHGQEDPQFCQHIKDQLPEIELIKAFRIKDRNSLENLKIYYDLVDTLLLDAYHPQLLGGSGQTIDWQTLQDFTPPLPWLLAGGLNCENVTRALNQLKPDGIDLSSGVENSPGDKNLAKIRELLENLKINQL
ncbi:MAG: phosphoribosylanthranilate isomerase [Cyanobacteriota bacterium ELA615]